MRKVLVGIPVLDNVEITRACLQHLYLNTETDRLGLSVSVLIIDNGSHNNIEDIFREEFKDPKHTTYFLRNSENIGVAAAWNQILRFAPEKVSGQPFYSLLGSNTPQLAAGRFIMIITLYRIMTHYSV
jgi:GT2 family glycosyltransferase